MYWKEAQTCQKFAFKLVRNAESTWDFRRRVRSAQVFEYGSGNGHGQWGSDSLGFGDIGPGLCLESIGLSCCPGQGAMRVLADKKLLQHHFCE